MDEQRSAVDNKDMQSEGSAFSTNISITFYTSASSLSATAVRPGASLASDMLRFCLTFAVLALALSALRFLERFLGLAT